MKSTPTVPWEPARHDQDDWMEQASVKHRLVFDTTKEPGFRESLLFAGNFMAVNRDDYGMQNQDLALMVIARHMSTAFAYNDAMWAKYGMPMAQRAGFVDPRTKEPPVANVHSRSLNSLANQGVKFAVCSMATRANAGLIARAVSGDADAIFAELSANLVNNARLVPAGIVAVNRAQERGYSLVSA